MPFDLLNMMADYALFIDYTPRWLNMPADALPLAPLLKMATSH